LARSVKANRIFAFIWSNLQMNIHKLWKSEIVQKNRSNYTFAELICSLSKTSHSTQYRIDVGQLAFSCGPFECHAFRIVGCRHPFCRLAALCIYKEYSPDAVYIWDIVSDIWVSRLHILVNT
jgi:hypothetical protein